MDVFGALLGGNAADAHKRALTTVANTPNVDLNNVYQQSTLADLLALPQFQHLNEQAALGQQGTINKVADQAIPGYSKLQSQRSNNALSLLNGEIPDDVAALVNRNRNARAITGGYGGSARQGNLTARDLGLTSLGLQDKGEQATEGILRSTPMAQTTSPLSQLINPSQHYSALLDERAKKMDLDAQVAGAPGKTDVWSKYLTNQGAALQGMVGSAVGGAAGGGM